ncbi:pilus assembly protein PilC [Marinobacter salinexigens]|uniref:Pilus assembly protein PilC n=1 Tax=Marinobacter salinexigens TaxID=2919747 RepID=A0A5B0VAN5_9GAMM|nr:PilC/PilY family type IV pilus protein [Marinobacter salinexigens]KAA1171692.1 pilus assembly protein PilC [Marinobacter salinexigens]
MKNIVKHLKGAVIGLCLVAPVTGYAAPGVIADEPLYLAGGRGVPGNLVLTPSVEYPTLQSIANIDNDYASSKEFTGYFDSGKCYVYDYDATESERHFYPTSLTNSRTCGGAGEWSGNFLNWATTQTIDPFRKVLTGGYRVRDTATETWLEKARHPGQSGFQRILEGSTAVAGATPFTADKITILISGQGISMNFSLNNLLPYQNVHNYNPSTFDYWDDFSYRAAVRVKVCDASVGVEDNCVQYSQGWKPEGVIQKNAETIRYSVFGYLNHSSNVRDGGVLRARQKFVGPTMTTPENGVVANPNTEWDQATGVLIRNPDPVDASNTPGVIADSGVINYLNKFGQLNDFNHKSLDPVSELYYAATRYLKGLPEVSSYSALTGYTDDEIARFTDNFPVIEDWADDDPVQYECQPMAILGIGDVNTHDDKNLPGNDTYRQDEPTMPSEVQNDDTVNVISRTNQVGVMEGITSLGETNSFTGRENSAYIAGLAYDNHITDIRPGKPGKQTISTYWVDVLENQKLEPKSRNQYYMAAKYGGFKVPDNFDPDTQTDALEEELWYTNNDVVTVGNVSFKRPDNFYIAGEASLMIASLEQAFADFATEAEGTSSGVTFNTATLDTDTLLFGASFDSATWSGELYALNLEEDPNGGAPILGNAAWSASEALDARDIQANPRNIITYSGSSGLAFTYSNWASFTQDLKDDLEYGDSTLAEARVNYLRGDITDGRLRERASRLGDIVNSTPVYVGEPSLSWPNAEPFGTADLQNPANNNLYADFRAEQEFRSPVIYAGANDGMLHAFNVSDGSELFAYIPEFLASSADQEGLHFLTDPNYLHRYYADLAPRVSDIFTAGPNGASEDWRTILIGGGRTGAKGIFALDITNPSSLSEGNAANMVMWEFTSDDDDRLGYITEPPTVGLADWGNQKGYRWTVFLPNGYNSTTVATGLFMLDIEAGLDGSWEENGDYRFIEFDGANDATGLSAIRQLDISGDRIIDRIYAGDLKGNVWVAESGNNGSWSDAYNGPLFTASRSGVSQPITSAPMVVRNPVDDENNAAPDLMVLFGTGQYLTQPDTANTDVQSFYGILDSGVSGLDRSDLVGRTLSETTITVDGTSYNVRSSTGDDFDTQNGWYVDFTTESGERIVQAPQVRGEYVFVNSTVPTNNPCDVGGSGWIMAFGLDGQTPDRAVWPKLGAPYVGFKTQGGLPNPTSFLGDYAIIPRSDNELLSEEIDVGDQNPSLGRMSWQELYE